MFERFMERAVADDLVYLESRWVGRVEGGELRRGATVLRKLLVDGALGKVWRSAGFTGEPNIIAPRLEFLIDVLSAQPGIEIEWAFAGGADFGDMALTLPFLALGIPKVPQEAAWRSHEFTLTSFRESHGLYWKRQVVTRRELVQYMANRAGGAHFGFPRPGQRVLYSLLDECGGITIPVGGQHPLNIVYCELLSIGQAVVRSPDVQRLLAKIRGRAGGT